jgi:thioredoxin-related protein
VPLSTAAVARRIILIAAVFAMSFALRALAQEPDKPKPSTAPPAATTSQPTTSSSQPARPNIYDPAADAKAQIAAAVDKAKRENQRVLLMFGGNWCPWCHKLHELFASDKDIAKTLLYEYQLVLVDIGRRDKNLDILKSYDIDLKKGGVPFLTVLDENGKVLANQETGSLEAGDHHDPEKVAAFLDKWKPQPRDAEKLLKDSLTRAKKEDKTVLVHLGAPWCPWCRRLDDFLAQKDIARILQADIIDLKIDVDRMTNGKDVAKRLRTDEKGGLPWMVLLDAEGKALATSDGPKGNIGYPAEPEEIAHFLAMLKKAGHRITADQIGRIEKALKDAAAKLKSPTH